MSVIVVFLFFIVFSLSCFAEETETSVEPEATETETETTEGEETTDETEEVPESATVTEVNDDGTIELDSGETVQLLGVDVSEIGEVAVLFLTGLLVGNTIDLVYDQMIYDDYGNLLAYAYLPNDTCVNVEVILSGYGMVYAGYNVPQKLDRALRWIL